jgi:hypothetical protein
VTYVSWFDAARYCNWLHNRLPSGTQNASTTEDGAYTLNGATSDGLAISKNAVATYWIPSENEWYKAAYYQPTAAGGDSDGYWLYPTRSNSVPGNVIGTTANQANYYTTVYSVTQSDSYIGIQNYLTDRGAYSGSASHYGTFDQGGNVWEWNDAVIGVVRGLRGNSWSVWPSATELQSSHRGYSDPTYEVNYIGFRVARLPDTDGDGIADQFETGTGIYVSPENTGTSPTNPDTDGDGLTDGAEVYTHQSSPNLRDTDGDGFEDGFEVSTGFSPTSATSTPDALSSIRTAARISLQRRARNQLSHRSLHRSRELADDRDGHHRRGRRDYPLLFHRRPAQDASSVRAGIDWRRIVLSAATAVPSRATAQRPIRCAQPSHLALVKRHACITWAMSSCVTFARKS